MSSPQVSAYALGGPSLLPVGVGKSRELVLVKLGGCSLLRVGASKIDECYLNIIKERHYVVFSRFGFLRKFPLHCV